ncbi:MAG: hypothetical protein H0Z31_05345 [Bacillus sp. (in: Bacteria)]|nr:hypothetical protein [Bacillus sp. (in: firmicutes)]
MLLQMEIIKKLKTSHQIRCSKNNHFLCHTMERKTVIYRQDNWEIVKEIKRPSYPANIRFFNNDNHLLINSTDGQIYIYDTNNFEKINEFRSRKNFRLIEGDINITNDNRQIILPVISEDKAQIGVINIQTGERKLLTNFQYEDNILEYNQYISSEKKHLFTLTFINLKGFYENKLVKVSEPVEESLIEEIYNKRIMIWEKALYNPIFEHYILVNETEIILLNKEFNKVINRKSISNGKDIGYFYHVGLSNDGNYILLTFSKYIFILKYDDLSIVRSEKIPYACFGEFSSDDQHLYIGTWKEGYILKNNL